MREPDQAQNVGVWEILVPVGGAFIVGLMARYGSERIRGHGIREAIGSYEVAWRTVTARRYYLSVIDL